MRHIVGRTELVEPGDGVGAAGQNLGSEGQGQARYVAGGNGQGHHVVIETPSRLRGGAHLMGAQCQ